MTANTVPLAELIHLITGIAIGVLLVGVIWWIRRGSILKHFDSLSLDMENYRVESERLKSEREEEGRELAVLRDRSGKIPELEKGLEESNQIRETAVRELDVLRERLKSEQDAAREKEQFLEKAKKDLNTQFENLANRIFEDKSGKFVKKNEEKLSELLKPFRDRMKEFQDRVEEVHREDIRERSSLQNELKHLKELNTTLSKEAQNLTSALKGDAKKQGDWGEFVLESYLENAGLKKDVHYYVQDHTISEDGRRLRPDIVVRLPNQRSIVIDSKVSLTAYERYAAAEEEPERDEAARDHLLSVRNHIASLSSKGYQESYREEGDLDFVLLFMPIEPALLLALSRDSELFGEAYNRNILLVNPSTLLLALRIVSNLWRQEQQTRNVKDIAEQGAKLYEKFCGFTEDFEKIGTRLKQTMESYDGAFGKLSSGRGNLIRQAEKLKEMGIRPRKNLSQVFDENIDTDLEDKPE